MRVVVRGGWSKRPPEQVGKIVAAVITAFRVTSLSVTPGELVVCVVPTPLVFAVSLQSEVEAVVDSVD
jgi:hypothetical protein